MLEVYYEIQTFQFCEILLSTKITCIDFERYFCCCDLHAVTQKCQIKSTIE